MTLLKLNGDLAELKVAADLRERGFLVAFPYGEACSYDLIVDRGDRLERQVKYTRSNGRFVRVRCFSHSMTRGRVKATKRYTAAIIDWLAVYDVTSERCYYVPARELGDGRGYLHLRLTPAKNNQRRGIRDAQAYLGF